MLFVHLAEPASSRDLQVKHILRGGLVAFKNRVLGLAIPMFPRE